MILSSPLMTHISFKKLINFGCGFRSKLISLSALFYSLLFVSLCLFHSGYCSVLDEIDKEYIARYQKFDIDRDDGSLVVHTTKIADIFSDPNKINYKKQATDADKKRAFKAMMGNIMVHNGTVNSLYKVKPFKDHLYENLYQRQLEALNTIDTAIRILWDKFNKHESHRLQDIFDALSSKPNARKFDCKKLLTNHFVDWFYETLEQHLPEQNFFVGTATREWFDKASNLYAKKKVTDFTQHKFEIILENDSEPIALYKSLIPKIIDEEVDKKRQIKVEFISWLIAKEIGITEVVNPVLPVRKTAKGFVIDPVNYDGCLSPIAGLILKNDKNALDKYGNLKELLSGMLGVCETTEETEGMGYNYNCFGKNKTTLYAPWLRDYGYYFSIIDDLVTGYKTPFIDYYRGTNIDNKMKDLTVFQNSISAKHLLDVIVFWYLTLQGDLNYSNIVYVPNQKEQIIPTIIDYDLAFRKTKRVIVERIPTVYMLPQAKQILPTELLDKLLTLSERRLTRIIENHKKASPHDLTSEFTSDDSLALAQRVTVLKELARQRPASTLKEMMINLYKINGCSLNNWLLMQACHSVGVTILDPIFPCENTYQLKENEKDLGQLSLKDCSIHPRIITLPWIYEVKDKKQLKGCCVMFRELHEIFNILEESCFIR